MAACDRAGPFSSRPGLSWEIVLIAPQHPVECLWHSLLRPYPAFEAPFNGHGTVFFLPSWSSLFQLRMTRNWSAPVCLPGSEESGSMRRSPIGFQERRQVGGTAIRFMRVDDCLLPRFFSRYLYKADTNTAKAVPSLSAGNQELGPRQGLYTKSPCLSPNTSVQRAQFLDRPPVGEELAAMDLRQTATFGLLAQKPCSGQVYAERNEGCFLPTAQDAQSPPPCHRPSTWSLLLWVL